MSLGPQFKNTKISLDSTCRQVSLKCLNLVLITCMDSVDSQMVQHGKYSGSTLVQYLYVPNMISWSAKKDVNNV